MAELKLIIAPDAILQRRSQIIEKITPSIIKLSNDMLDTMYANNGIGLSAVQVGILQRIITVDVKWPDINRPSDEQYIMINPEIIKNSLNKNEYNEGCLSFPNESVTIARPEVITVKYLNIDGKEHTIEADGLLATCIQHEIDHLNGVTITSYISSLKRNMMLSRLKKFKRNG